MENPVFLLGFGLFVLCLSGEGIVRGAVTVAHALRVSPLIIGLTIIAFGTSAPELTVSIQAAMRGAGDIAIGNVVGSNIANILLVLSVMALVRSFVVDDITIKRDGSVMLASTAALVGLALYGEISRLAGGGLLLALLIYGVYLFRAPPSKQQHDTAPSDDIDDNLLRGGVAVGLLVLGAGLIGIVWSGNMLVSGAIELARQFGLSETVIGLSVIAIGTSLPELGVAIFAALRGHAGLAIGNIIGSNIANILLILGVTASLTPLTIAPEIAARDIWVMAIAAVL
ncbi:MAG: calcium/sodium antiporter, partial [Parvibaculales bacterium]